MNNFDLGIPKANYNHMDGRLNLCDLEESYSFALSQQIRKLGESVACMIELRDLVPGFPIKEGKSVYYLPDEIVYHLSDKVMTLTQFIRHIKGVDLGKKEKFLHEPTPGGWTGFFIGDNKLLTAAHCVCKQHSDVLLSSEKIQGMMIVFGFQMTDAVNYKKTFSKSEVYGIKKVLDHRWSRGTVYADWAILELDRKVEGRAPLKLNFSENAVGNVCMLGHPTGLPLKFVGHALIKRKSFPDFIETDLSAFQGNSGSPIFKIDFKLGTLEVIAILTQGNLDYKIDQNYRNTGKSKVRVHYVSSQEIEKHGYEIGQRISAIDSLPLREFRPPSPKFSFFRIAPYFALVPFAVVLGVAKLLFKPKTKSYQEEHSHSELIEDW